MTPQHIFYIPLIFLLGLVLGLTIGDKRSLNTVHKEAPAQAHGGKNVLYSFFVFVIMFILTHIVDLPYNSKNVSKLLGHEIFDKSPTFTANKVYAAIDTFHPEGIKAYLIFTFTTDLAFPLAFLLLLLSFSRYFNNKVHNQGLLRKLINGLPYGWFGFDLLENLLVFQTLYHYPLKNNLVAGSIGFVTMIKFILLFSSIITPLVSFLLHRSKANKR